MRPLCLLTEKEKSGMIKMVTFSCWCQLVDHHGHSPILGASCQIAMVSPLFDASCQIAMVTAFSLELVVRLPWSNLCLWSQLLDRHDNTSVLGASCQITICSHLCFWSFQQIKIITILFRCFIAVSLISPLLVASH